MTATNHNDQLVEIYPTMLNELNCTFGVSFFRVFTAVAVMLMVCGRGGLLSSWYTYRPLWVQPPVRSPVIARIGTHGILYRPIESTCTCSY